MENEDFIVAMDAVRLQAFQTWANTKPEQHEVREQNYYLLQATTKIRDNLEALVSNAQFEQKKIERNEAEASRSGTNEESE